MQAKDNSAKIIEDALALEEAGAFAVVVECVPEEVAKEITEKLKIPTIGIGAGREVDGQILVLNDILGLNKAFKPKFVKAYEDFYSLGLKAVKSYIKDVKEHRFPEDQNVYHKKS